MQLDLKITRSKPWSVTSAYAARVVVWALIVTYAVIGPALAIYYLASVAPSEPSKLLTFVIFLVLFTGLFVLPVSINRFEIAMLVFFSAATLGGIAAGVVALAGAGQTPRWWGVRSAQAPYPAG